MSDYQDFLDDECKYKVYLVSGELLHALATSISRLYDGKRMDYDDRRALASRLASLMDAVEASTD